MVARKTGWEMLRPVLQEAITHEVQASSTGHCTTFARDLTSLIKLCYGVPELQGFDAGVLAGLVAFQLSLPVRMADAPGFGHSYSSGPPSITPAAFATLYGALAAQSFDSLVRAAAYL